MAEPIDTASVKAFEKWAREEGHLLVLAAAETAGNWRYAHPAAENAWRGWQARGRSKAVNGSFL